MPDIHADTVAELKKVRAEIAALRHQHAVSLAVATAPRHLWLKGIIKGLETDPHVQYKVHLYGVVYWIINFPLICALFFGAPALWTKLGIFITLIYSIYANFATDYGAMSAAMAAYGGSPLPEIPVEAHVPSGSPDGN